MKNCPHVNCEGHGHLACDGTMSHAQDHLGVECPAGLEHHRVTMRRADRSRCHCTHSVERPGLMRQDCKSHPECHAGDEVHLLNDPRHEKEDDMTSPSTHTPEYMKAYHEKTGRTPGGRWPNGLRPLIHRRPQPPRMSGALAAAHSLAVDAINDRFTRGVVSPRSEDEKEAAADALNKEPQWRYRVWLYDMDERHAEHPLTIDVGMAAEKRIPSRTLDALVGEGKRTVGVPEFDGPYIGTAAGRAAETEWLIEQDDMPNWTQIALERFAPDAATEMEKLIELGLICDEEVPF